jgi:serine protease Do
MTLAVTLLATLSISGQGASAPPPSPAALYARISPAVVTVVSPRLDGGIELGSGIVVHKDGWIVTAAHVVEDSERAVVKLHETADPVPATVVSISRTEDIALLKLGVALPKEIVPATFGNSDALKVGDWIGCIGTPFGLEETFTTGVVSAIRTNFGNEWSLGPKKVIQTDAAINQGNSGGALFNAKGEIVGIASSIRTAGKDAGNVGLGFAVPSNTVKKRLFEEPLPALGVLLRRIPEPLGRALHWDVPGGALLVEKVIPDSAAARAGMRGGFVPASFAGYEVLVGGDIIIAVGPHTTQDGAAIAQYLRTLKPGDTLTYTVVRESHRGKIDVVIPNHPPVPRL